MVSRSAVDHSVAEDIHVMSGDIPSITTFGPILVRDPL